MKTEAEVKTIILDILYTINEDSDLTTLDPEASLKDQLGMDSMDFLDIVQQLKKHHHLDITAEEYVNFRTLNKAISYLMMRFNDEGV